MTALCGRAGPAPRDMTRPATWTDCRVRLGGIRKGLPTAVMPPLRIGSEGLPKTPRRVEAVGLPRIRSTRAATSRRLALWSTASESRL